MWKFARAGILAGLIFFSNLAPALAGGLALLGVGVPATGTPPPVPATFIAASAPTPDVGTGIITFTPGASSGDLLIIYLNNFTTTTITANGSGAAMILAGGPVPLSNSGPDQYLFYKVLTSSDISDGTLTVNSIGLYASALTVIYRGATTATVQSFTASAAGANSLVMPGFTPSAGTKGVVGLVIDRDTAATPAVPTSWASRAAGVTGIYWAGLIGDRLTGYTNAAVTWTGFQTTYEQGGFLVELQ